MPLLRQLDIQTALALGVTSRPLLRQFDIDKAMSLGVTSEKFKPGPM